MPLGYVLDAYPNEQTNRMQLWLKGESGADRIYALPYRPTLYVGGDQGELQRLARLLTPLSSVSSVELQQRRVELHERPARPVLAVEPARLDGLLPLARMVERIGNHRTFRLFNVDLRLPHRFLEHLRLYPTAQVQWDGQRPNTPQALQVRGDRWALDYPMPPLRSVHLSIEGQRTGTLPSLEDPLGSVTLTPFDLQVPDRWGEPMTLRPDHDGDEAGLLTQLVATVRRTDPDVVTTLSGDSVLLPHLYARARAHDMEGTFTLGRQPSPRVLGRPEGRSFFTYGKVVYKPMAHLLRGRLHVDRRNFHMFEGGLLGVFDLSRISGVPFQETSRLSPGSTVSLMYVAEAMNRGVLVKWKKNLPEELKTLHQLQRSDRGGMVLTPLVGLHVDVHEVDFASLYPSLMVVHNISPETLWCPHPCCQAPERRVPELGYWFCAQEVGVVPVVLARLLERRRACRASRHIDPRAAQVDALLKWVGVVSFGYTGYRNARFGRIECHEAIGAYARDVLTHTMGLAQRAGFDILHGIVDSLWLQGEGDAQDFCRQVSEHWEQRLRLAYEGHFRWIVFLPNRTTGVGALTRYYGVFDDGTIKVRGVELRQRSTPDFLRTVQEQVLRLLANAPDGAALSPWLAAALEYTTEQRAALLAQQVDPRSLVLRVVVSKERSAYRVLTAPVAALEQYAAEGTHLQAGQCVEYLVTKLASRDWRTKVCIGPLVGPRTRYDARFYVGLLHRAVASLLAPFGWDEAQIASVRPSGSVGALLAQEAESALIDVGPDLPADPPVSALVDGWG